MHSDAPPDPPDDGKKKKKGDALGDLLGRIVGSVSEWSTGETEGAVFVPPPGVAKLRDHCDRILFLLSTRQLSAMPIDVRVAQMSVATRILRYVERADDARRRFLNARATALRRDRDMNAVTFYLDEACKEAGRLARELEQDWALLRGKRRKAQPYEASVRALQRVVQRLSNPAWWCKGAEACNLFGRPVRWNSADAVSFSLVGAISAATQVLEARERRDAFGFVAYVLKVRRIPAIQEWNDKLATGQEDVLDVLDRAIHALRKYGDEGGGWQTNLPL